MADRSAPLMPSRRWAVCILVVLVGVLATRGGQSDGSERRKTAIVLAQETARPAVVNIRGEKTITTAGTQLGHAEVGRRVNGMGTGVVIDPRGYVLTNHHVVDGVREIQVTLDSGAKHTAKLIARDSETDLAIVKLDVGRPLPVIPVGTSSDLMLGETVIALGNAFGYEGTVTQGIVSSLHRPVQVSDAQFYDDLIQTDAPINPGNSGGPLLNIDGEMIGLNVAVRAGAQGIGFAIPVDKAMAVAAELMAGAGLKNHWHGIALAKDAAAPGKGVVVASVEKESPAEKAGLKPGDVVTAAGDEKLDRPLDFYRAVLDLGAGQKVALAVQRGEEKLSLSVALAEPPRYGKRFAESVWDTLGLELKPIADDSFNAQYAKFRSDYRGGMLVTAVRPQSPAAERGIGRGDVLVGLHDRETTSLKDLHWILTNTDFSRVNTVCFWLIRNGKVVQEYVPLSVAMVQALRR